ncbi:hypothetical protein M885DRAFT_618345 [Pelagophyceae sp. CCMP2097]|nr:hypothetical protein M885DRAFT_618345 [Pelagophyceae sp. CCMP2097]
MMAGRESVAEMRGWIERIERDAATQAQRKWTDEERPAADAPRANPWGSSVVAARMLEAVRPPRPLPSPLGRASTEAPRRSSAAPRRDASSPRREASSPRRAHDAEDQLEARGMLAAWARVDSEAAAMRQTSRAAPPAAPPAPLNKASADAAAAARRKEHAVNERRARIAARSTAMSAKPSDEAAARRGGRHAGDPPAWDVGPGRRAARDGPVAADDTRGDARSRRPAHDAPPEALELRGVGHGAPGGGHGAPGVAQHRAPLRRRRPPHDGGGTRGGAANDDAHTAAPSGHGTAPFPDDFELRPRLMHARPAPQPRQTHAPSRGEPRQNHARDAPDGDYEHRADDEARRSYMSQAAERDRRQVEADEERQRAAEVERRRAFIADEERHRALGTERRAAAFARRKLLARVIRAWRHEAVGAVAQRSRNASRGADFAKLRSTGAVRTVFSVWRSCAAYGAEARRRAGSRAAAMRFEHVAGRVLRAWAFFVAKRRAAFGRFVAKRRSRRTLAVWRGWRSRCADARKSAVRADALWRWLVAAHTWRAWRRVVEAGRAARAAADMERHLRRRKQLEEKATRFASMRLRSRVFVQWLEATLRHRGARELTEEHAARRLQVDAFGARLRQAAAPSAEPPMQLDDRHGAAFQASPGACAASPAESSAAESSAGRSRSTYASSRLTPRPSSAQAAPSPADAPPAPPAGAARDAAARRARREDIARRTAAQVAERRRRDADVEKRRETVAERNFESARDAAAVAAAQLAGGQRLARQDAALARQEIALAALHCDRAALKWRGLGPWKEFVAAARLDVVKADRWYADGLTQTAWAAWVGFLRQLAGLRTTAKRRAVLNILLGTATRRCSCAWAIWAAAVREVAARGDGVAAVVSAAVAARAWVRWRAAAPRAAEAQARLERAASALVAKHLCRSTLANWRNAASARRAEAQLDARSHARWGHVRAWLGDESGPI